MLSFGKAWTEEEIRQMVHEEVEEAVNAAYDDIMHVMGFTTDVREPEEHPYAWMGHLAIDSLAALRAYLGVALSEVPAAIRDILKKS